MINRFCLMAGCGEIKILNRTHGVLGNYRRSFGATETISYIASFKMAKQFKLIDIFNNLK